MKILKCLLVAFLVAGCFGSDIPDAPKVTPTPTVTVAPYDVAAFPVGDSVGWCVTFSSPYFLKVWAGDSVSSGLETATLPEMIQSYESQASESALLAMSGASFSAGVPLGPVIVDGQIQCDIRPSYQGTPVPRSFIACFSNGDVVIGEANANESAASLKARLEADYEGALVDLLGGLATLVRAGSPSDDRAREEQKYLTADNVPDARLAVGVTPLGEVVLAGFAGDRLTQTGVGTNALAKALVDRQVSEACLLVGGRAAQLLVPSEGLDTRESKSQPSMPTGILMVK